MMNAYLRILIRVVVLGILLSGLMMLSQSQVVLAGETCQQCLQNCQNQIAACVAQCEAEGQTGCQVRCRPPGGNCPTDCFIFCE